MTGSPLPTLDDVFAGAEHCSYNAKLCRYACPVARATGKESVTPWGINRAITAAVRAGSVSDATAAAVYGCTGCRSCGGMCLPGLDLPTHVRAARAEVVVAGLAPEGAEAAAGTPTAPAHELAVGATPGATTVVYPGCRSADGPALAALLAAAGEAYDVVGMPSCCGARSVDLGYAARGLADESDLTGWLGSADTVVVADPHCARWLGVDCDDERVVSLPAFLAGLLDRLPLRQPAGTVAWQDPCWLGRGGGSYEEPRSVLRRSGATLVEPARTREHAGCTGGGMGYEQVDPAGADAILRERAGELAAVLPGDGQVVTGCPTAAARLRSAGLDAYDLAGWLVCRLTQET